MTGQLGNVLYYLLAAVMFFLTMRFGCGAALWQAELAQQGRRHQNH
jgi:hypothetical protein